MREEIRKRAEMIRRGDVPEGYKQTKVGIIPGEWEVRQIKDFGKVITGSTPPTKDNSYYNGEFPWVTPTDINGEKYIDSTLKQLTKKGLEKSRILPEDSVLVTCIASIGKNCILKSKGSCNQQINAIVVNSKNNFEFLYYVISHNTDRMKVFAGQTATQIINKTTFEKFTIASPQLNEQTTIAQILSTADKAIETTETLITLKEQKKKWLMQNLLTGKVRLPGFNGEWESKRIKDMLSYEQPTKYLTNNIVDSAFNAKIPVLTANKSFLLGYTSDTEGICKNLPIIIFDDFTIASKYVVFPFKVKSSAIKLLSAKPDTNLRYVYERMQLIKLPNESHKRYYISEYSFLKVKVPPFQEQKAIANILTTADKEITLLHQKLDTLKKQKKALMQLLLTGIVRTTGLNLSSDTEEEGVAYAGK